MGWWNSAKSLKKRGVGPNLIKVVPKWNGWWNLSKTGIYAWEITLLRQILFLVLGQVSVTAALKPIVITIRSKCAVALSRNHFFIHLVTAIHLSYSAQRFNLLESVFFSFRTPKYSLLLTCAAILMIQKNQLNWNCE